jgi:tripartite-type tricarboxylate transporter receptor subunit TctC
VPLALDFAKSTEDRQVMEIVCAPSATGYPSFMGPDVPKDRLDAIRTAFQKTMKDPRFIELVQKQKLELDPIDADEIDGIVKGIYSKPENVVEKMRALMPPS